MGTSLPRYLEMKMHQALRERCYDRIVVTGAYARTAPLEEVFQGEKTDKDFNWQRPTALLVGKELHIRCFPGNDHVVRKFNDRLVAFVGCRPSFWGDIAGEIVHYLAASKRISEVLYFGKLGSVKKGIRPNNYLATGSSSYVSGQLVMWQNALEPSVNLVAPEHTIFGTHITLGSVLHETRDWLGELPASVDFVDPEIGMMAQAAVRSGIGVSYLHIISDNVAEKYHEDLSNERKKSVLVGRSSLYEVVQDVL
ncbi:hypothetical protein EG328_011516 [Venturia inaequalis]|uniref:Nucleoside phosphorylase domain-containing protein n=1 Tax=Venturia inaequalis TaxID=5025 RepID=A0A8H3U4V6_VENIN|nr:hypothetical protein EG328_011516 [Venturia inaequalis]